MLPKRVIPCLDVDAGRVVKGTGFVDIQDVGDPVALAKEYEAQGADELVFLDITATAEGRSTMVGIAQKTAANVFIPFTIGGGVRNETDAQALLDAGADKVAINSATLAEPSLIDRLAVRFGRQCVVLAIDAKRREGNSWEAYSAGGRIATGREVADWAKEAVCRGAGEVLLTSIDQDGTNDGYDLDLIKSLTRDLKVPVIASGGAGRLRHYRQAIQDAGADAVLTASQLHSGQTDISEIKTYLRGSGIPVRQTPASTSRRDAPELSASSPRISIVDYGTGNRQSVKQALRRTGAYAEVTADSDELAASDGIVLPGVGAFQPAMENLREGGLDKVLRRLAELGKPILGICLGEQLLFDSSEEGGWSEGLGLIPGLVQEINTNIRPNIGWRKVDITTRDDLVKGLAEEEYFYHLHQYAASPAANSIMGQTAMTGINFMGTPITTVVRDGNLCGVQFHPEKSSAAGLRLLENFVQLSKINPSEI